MHHSPLRSCASCGGFAPRAASSCPHCSEALTPAPPSAAGASWASRLARALMTTAGGGLLMTTLMACYGAPHGAWRPPEPDTKCAPSAQDKDGDCLDAATDCDDGDPLIGRCAEGEAKPSSPEP